jgi:mRNA interferase MazF
MGQATVDNLNGYGEMDMADPIRGEIWPADLGAGHGHEQSGQRPVLVVSENAFNAGLAGLVMTVPLTSKVGKSKNIPAHIRVDPPEGGLKTPSVLLCDQLRALSKGRLGKAPWGTVSAATLAEVEKALCVLLGL